MFTLITRRLHRELDHYHHLSPDIRRLLISYYLYLVAYPLFAVFTNAYLWRAGQDLKLLVVYNLFYCFGLPIGFYLNGWLLKRFHALKLYAVGGVLEGLAGVLIVMLPTGHLWSLMLYGLIAGLGAGLYWGNKNYLSLRLTRGSNRLYYNTLESAGDMLINMVVPGVAGLFIVYGQQIGWYTPTTAYKWLMFIALILVGLAGYVVQSSTIQDLHNEPMFLRHPTSSWRWVRLYNLLTNIVVGTEFVIPSVLVLVLVGQEGTLGLISSLTAVLSAISLYILGRLGNVHTAWKIVGVADLIYLFGALLLAQFFTPFVVIIFMAITTIGWAFRWPPAYTVIMEIMDREPSSSGQYAYVCDNELAFNLGRSLGLITILSLLGLGQTTTLRTVPLLTAFTSLLALWPLVKLTRLLPATDHTPLTP